MVFKLFFSTKIEKDSKIKSIPFFLLIRPKYRNVYSESDKNLSTKSLKESLRLMEEFIIKGSYIPLGINLILLTNFGNNYFNSISSSELIA